MLLDQMNQHHTGTNQKYQLAPDWNFDWCQLLFLAKHMPLFHALTLSTFSLQVILRTPDSRYELKDMQGKQYIGPKTPGLGTSSLKRPNATGREPWVSVRVCGCASVLVCTVLAQSGWMTLCTRIHWHQPCGSPGLNRLRTHHMLFWVQCQSHEEHSMSRCFAFYFIHNAMLLKVFHNNTRPYIIMSMYLYCCMLYAVISN